MIETINNTLKRIREQSPLVHNITNYVVMNNTANALLAIGVSPVMAHAYQEIEDIVSISSALVLNMGTLSEQWVSSMLLAAETAQKTNTPFVFDPVGVGASKYRTETAQKIIAQATPDIIRGNASEIMALAKLNNTTKGVDSTINSENALEGAQKLSKELQNTIIISGKTDYIITSDRIDTIQNGSPLMSQVTGMGCTATAMVGACIAVEKNSHEAAISAMAIMGIAGEMAQADSKGSGTFQINFLDSLNHISPKLIQDKLQLNE